MITEEENLNLENRYKILTAAKIICAVLLLLALFKMPYGYYEFLRIAVSFMSFVLAYLNYNENKIIWAVIFGAVGVLFNPFLEIHFNKRSWVFLDSLTAILYFVSAITQKKSRRSEI